MITIFFKNFMKTLTVWPLSPTLDMLLLSRAAYANVLTQTPDLTESRFQRANLGFLRANPSFSLKIPLILTLV